MLSSDEVLDGGASYGGGASCSSATLTKFPLFALNNFILFFAVLKFQEVLREGSFSFILAAMKKNPIVSEIWILIHNLNEAKCQLFQLRDKRICQICMNFHGKRFIDSRLMSLR